MGQLGVDVGFNFVWVLISRRVIIWDVSMWWNGVYAKVKTVTNAVGNVGEGIKEVVGYELVLPGVGDEGGNDDEEVR